MHRFVRFTRPLSTKFPKRKNLAKQNERWPRNRSLPHEGIVTRHTEFKLNDNNL